MPVSDSQFTTWLEDSSNTRVLLAELDYYDSAVSPPDGTKYVSNLPFISRSTDTPALETYDDILLDIPALTTRIEGLLVGAASISWGDLEVQNENGDLDEWFTYTFGGRLVTIYIGDPTWPKADFRKIFVGTMEEIYAPSQGVLAAKLRSNMWFLNRPIDTGEVVGGSGPDSAKQVPLLIGSCFNVPLMLADEATQEYVVGVGPLSAVTQVKDNGVNLYEENFSPAVYTVLSWDAGTDVITAGPAADDAAPNQLTVGVRIVFFFGAPDGLSTGTNYWVVELVAGTNGFKVSTSIGGSAADITASDTGSIVMHGFGVTAPFLAGSELRPARRIYQWDAATNLLTSDAHEMSEGVRFVIGSGLAAAGLAAGTYYVLASGLSETTFKLSATVGGSEVDITSSGSSGVGGHSFTYYGWYEDLTNGRITLVAQPEGVVTADVIGIYEDSPPEPILTPGAALDFLARGYTDLPADSIDSAYLLAATFFSTSTAIGIGIRIEGGENLIDIFERIAQSVGAWFTFDRLGVLRLGYAPLPGAEGLPSQTPDFYLTEDDLPEGEGISDVRRDLPLRVVNLLYDRNWRPMPDTIAASVVGFRRLRLEREGLQSRLGSMLESDPLWSISNEIGYDTLVVDVDSSYGTFRSPASVVSDIFTSRFLAYRQEVVTVRRITVNANALEMELGDIVELTYSRFGFDAGSNAMIVGITDQPMGGKVTLEIWQ